MLLDVVANMTRLSSASAVSLAVLGSRPSAALASLIDRFDQALHAFRVEALTHLASQNGCVSIMSTSQARECDINLPYRLAAVSDLQVPDGSPHAGPGCTSLQKP